MPRKRARKQPEQKICCLCGGVFFAIKSHARFCSARCCSKVNYQKRAVPHTCVECGAAFTSKHHTASVCGPKCGMAMAARCGREGAAARPDLRKHASRADAYRVYGFNRRAAITARGSEIFSAEEIFERDGWLCQICGDEIDRDLMFPDRRSVSLDHIRPIARGGEHVRSNVQCAHLGCNSSKGATYFAEAVA